MLYLFIIYIYIYLYCIILIIIIEWYSSEPNSTWCQKWNANSLQMASLQLQPQVPLTYNTPTSGLDGRGDFSNTVQLPDFVQNPMNDRVVPCFFAWVRVRRMS